MKSYVYIYTTLLLLFLAGCGQAPKQLPPNCGERRLPSGAVCYEIAQVIPLDTTGTPNLKSADLDSDDDEDLIFARGGLILVLENINNEFSIKTTISIPRHIDDVLFGDFNGDNKLDVITRDSTGVNSAGFTILLNNDNLTFEEPIFFTNISVSDPSNLLGNGDIAIADLNGDGFSDIIGPQNLILGEPFKNANILINNRDLTFTLNKMNIEPENNTFEVGLGGITVIDLNGDNIQDIIFGNGTSTIVKPGFPESSGVNFYIVFSSGDILQDFTIKEVVLEDNFTFEGVLKIFPVDGNNDRRNDIVYLFRYSVDVGVNVNEFRILENRGGENFVSHFIESSFVSSIVSSDINQDGLIDLIGQSPRDVTGQPPGEIKIYINRGNFQFEPVVIFEDLENQNPIQENKFVRGLGGTIMLDINNDKIDDIITTINTIDGPTLEPSRHNIAILKSVGIIK
jgi:hypothetical protein